MKVNPLKKSFPEGDVSGPAAPVAVVLNVMARHAEVALPTHSGRP